MPAKLFKDFNKDTKDLLSKQYLPAGDWKLESKMKPADRTVILNPGFESKKGKTRLSVDVDYNVKEYGLKTKTTVSNDGSIKPKLTWEQSTNKVEFTLNDLTPEADFELTYEGSYPCNATLYDKFTRTGAEASASYAVTKELTVGAAATLAYPATLKSWSAGVRGTYNGYIVNVTTANLKTYTTGVFAPLKIGEQSLKIAAQVDCGDKDKFSATVGIEAPVSDFTVKAKVNTAANLTIAIVRQFADKWTAAVSISLDSAPKFGLTLTRE